MWKTYSYQQVFRPHPLWRGLWKGMYNFVNNLENPAEQNNYVAGGAGPVSAYF